MRIVVCAKQVPDTNEVRIDPVKGTLIRDGVPSILNPDDANALEEALRLKDTLGDVQVTVITMGPPQAEFMLRECLAMGADEAILLTDRSFGGSDTWATSNALAAAIRRLGAVDIVLVGRQAIDGDTAQVGPQIAERLDIPQVTYVQQLDLQPDGSFLVQRQTEDGYMLIRVGTPVLLSAVKELNRPRYLSITGIDRAYEQDIRYWSIEDIGIGKEIVGLHASPTKVHRSFTPELKGRGIVWEDSAGEMVSRLVAEMDRKHLLPSQ